jgi:hypothetical protein
LAGEATNQADRDRDYASRCEAAGHKPGHRGWLKAYWKYTIEREAVFERDRTQQLATG